MGNDVSEALLNAFNETFSDSMPSLLTTIGGVNYITKIINGQAVTKPAVKDTNHKGHRYVWAEEITPPVL